MSRFEASVVLPRTRVEAFEYLRRPSNMLKIIPIQSTGEMKMKVPEIMDLGELLEFEVQAMGNRFHFVHQVTDMKFHDRIALNQIRGPFKAWAYEHQFFDSDPGNTLLKTIVDYEPPGGILGFVVTRKAIHSFLDRWVGHGHEFFRKDLTTGDS